MSLFNKENYYISKKIVVLIISAVMLVFTLIGGTIAYLTSYTSPVENEFTPAEVSCEVIETFENNVKSDVIFLYISVVNGNTFKSSLIQVMDFSAVSLCTYFTNLLSSSDKSIAWLSA